MRRRVLPLGATAASITGAGAIASAEAVGAPAISATVSATAIASAGAFGTPALAAVIDTTGIASEEGLGAPTVAGVSPAPAPSPAPTPAPAPSYEIGGPVRIKFTEGQRRRRREQIEPAAWEITGAGDIASAEAFGNPTLTVQLAAAGNVSTREAFGAAQLAALIGRAGAIAERGSVVTTPHIRIPTRTRAERDRELAELALLDLV